MPYSARKFARKFNEYEYQKLTQKGNALSQVTVTNYKVLQHFWKMCCTSGTTHQGHFYAIKPIRKGIFNEVQIGMNFVNAYLVAVNLIGPNELI